MERIEAAAEPKANSPENSPAQREQRPVQILKQVILAPLPVVLALYVVALLTSMAGMEIFAWTTAALTLLYILVDRFSVRPDFKFFSIGPDLPLFALIIVVAIGCFINPPDPSTTILDEMGSIRWIILLYLFAYAMSLAPSLNRLVTIFIVVSTLVAGYAIFQHYTGIDLRQEWGLREASAVTPAPYTGSDVFQNVGFFSHHLTYGYSFAMAVCFPFSIFLLGTKKSIFYRWMMALITLVITLTIVWTYGRGVWVAAIAAFFLMTGFVSKKYLIMVALLVAVSGGTYYAISPGFKTRVDSIFLDDYLSNIERRVIWKTNIQMFQDNPWFGVGYGRNEYRTPEYYKKMGIETTFAGHAHNVYFQWLATTGFLGFLCYMLFILTFLLMSLRLWNEIPRTHFWHRVFILAALGAQVAMHAGGLTQWNFGDAEVNHQFIFILAMVAYMSSRYRSEIVPDDYAL